VTAAVGTLAWHLEQLGEHPCCCLVGELQCGLWCGHDGEHVPHIPGGYLLMPPLLSPLGRLRWARGTCPVCSRPLRPKQTGAGRFWLREAAESGEFGLYVWQIDGGFTVSRVGLLWRFWSCGCEAFEVER
jgi:hypothetical protein